jgi:phytoene/squalene synthetase
MPPRAAAGALRDPALALYAFCRLADDAVDLQRPKRPRGAAPA